jgi:hypothetical protein
MWTSRSMANGVRFYEKALQMLQGLRKHDPLIVPPCRR